MRTASEIYYTVILASLFFMVLVGVVIIAVWRYYHRKREHEKALVAFDHAMLQSRLEIQEQTFKTISQELHDNLGQTLTLAKLNLNTLNFHASDSEQEKLRSTVNLLTQTIQSIRDLSKNLHADIIAESGLVHALQRELSLIEKTGIIQPVLSVTGEPDWIDAGKCLIIFRIVQEALNNIVKHAEATVVELNIRCHTNSFELTVTDNGNGFTQSDGMSDGSGLRNMHDRARVIGAHVNIQPASPRGTIVTLTMPR